MGTAIKTYELHGIIPAWSSDSALRVSGKLPASVSYAKGQVMGELDGNNEFQRLTITGNPTGGTFTITFGGQTTAAIPWNAGATLIQTSLEAISSILPGNVYCFGGPLPNAPVIIEFRGALGRTDVAAVTTADSLTGGSTPATAVATLIAGSAGTPGTWKAYDPTRLATPATALTLTASGTNGTIPAGSYYMTYAWMNARGEVSGLAPYKAVSVSSTNNVAVTDLAALPTVVPAGVVAVLYFISDNPTSGVPILVAATNVVTGPTILHMPGLGQVPPPPPVGASATADGSNEPKGVLEFTAITDASGNITLGDTTGSGDHGETFSNCPIFTHGYFRTADLIDLDQNAVDRLGRIMQGTIANGVFQLY